VRLERVRDLIYTDLSVRDAAARSRLDKTPLPAAPRDAAEPPPAAAGRERRRAAGAMGGQ
jgi:hypothetical protein